MEVSVWFRLSWFRSNFHVPWILRLIITIGRFKNIQNKVLFGSLMAILYAISYLSYRK